MITDRAARYRANAPECRPRGFRICAFCWSARDVGVHHVDGNEQNAEPANLAWACRSCNGKISAVIKRHGLGVRTRQFNPKNSGARTLAQWVTAVLSMKGESDAMEPAAAIALIHATPAGERSQFARQIWRIRRKHGTDHRA